jgi:hypothetical protein
MATVVGAIIVVEMALILWRGYGDTHTVHAMATGAMADWSNTRLIGKLIYTDYIYAFEIAPPDPAGGHHRRVALTARHARTAAPARVGSGQGAPQRPRAPRQDGGQAAAGNGGAAKPVEPKAKQGIMLLLPITSCSARSCSRSRSSASS